MIKKLLTYSLFCFTVSALAQTSTEEDLITIESTKQIDSFLQAKKHKGNKVVTFNEEKHKTILAKELFSMSRGAVKIKENEFEKTFYKVLEKNKTPYYRVSYIYLDGAQQTEDDITNLRSEIVTKYKNGIPFSYLAKQYSMDAYANKGGDLGWFTEGKMPIEFEAEVINGNHSLEDIFSVDIPETNAHYLVLQTHEPKHIAEIKVLKIVEAIN
ncbi:peptidylprolyl isomerase [Aestuariibaculum lutulentum]|uniref:Peptidyl-prolyl cis-trans isomerase n=1 Tax=Aestuariibaculum lutulentum TaxID=2920935 RepID=A0ABS9RHY7_9FLAO|nr:peptidylprolyl isomerase [Aestuariibaculum lutulentum]MCH4552560.1 peptidyl-prolyl cis-trans isomerase [Aestuariibaculum lutulentum]